MRNLADAKVYVPWNAALSSRRPPVRTIAPSPDEAESAGSLTGRFRLRCLVCRVRESVCAMWQESGAGPTLSDGMSVGRASRTVQHRPAGPPVRARARIFGEASSPMGRPQRRPPVFATRVMMAEHEILALIAADLGINDLREGDVASGFRRGSARAA